MNPLLEIPDVRQIPGEHRRRWFASDAMDLIVWLDEAGAVVGFQLCYDKGVNERALTFTAGGGVTHASVDDGERGGGGIKETPILVASQYFDRAHVLRVFTEAKSELPEEIATLVSDAVTGQKSPSPGAA